jgi:hypothetical protein
LVNANTAIRMVGVALGFLFVQDSSTLTRAEGKGGGKRENEENKNDVTAAEK